MKLIQDSGQILFILLLCTCLVVGAGAVVPSSADSSAEGSNTIEQYWHQPGPGTDRNHATSQALHPLFKWNRDIHSFLVPGTNVPGTNGENGAGIVVAPAGPPEGLLSSSDYSGQDTLNPEFVRTLCSGFIKNRGQYDPAVEYILQYQGTTVFFTQDGFVLTHSAGDAENRTTDVIRQTFGDASPDVSIAGLDEREGRVNYYVGNDSSQWLTNIPVYGEILYEDLYPGIDLVYSEENGRLKREFRVAPGASFDLIKILYDDGITPSVDDAGILQFASPAGEMLESPLVCWQVIEGEKVSRTATYLVEEGLVRIVVDGYDPGYELVIDPELVYSTYLGGSGGDRGYALASDDEGGVWVAGTTWSDDFPVTVDAWQEDFPGDRAAFISRFSSNGALLYSTYLGGRSHDHGNALAPDGSGGIWVAGWTWSEDFPVTDDAYQGSHPGSRAAFVSRFSSNGALLYSTYLGGRRDDHGNALAPDGEGGIWVAGGTWLEDFPVTDDAYQGSHPGSRAAFVSRFSSNGALLYSTYLGGSSLDRGYALTTDGAGGIWITGYTNSEDFPVTDDAWQEDFPGDRAAFVSRFSSNGALLYSTYLGGRSHDHGNALAPDGSGGIWVAGGTWLEDFPVTDDAYQGSHPGSRAAFVARFSSAGVLLYSTYLGGSVDEGWDYALAPDGSGGVWVTGVTLSDDFPVTDDAYQGSRPGRDAAFVSRFSSSGVLLYSTYLGGSGIAIYDGDSGRALAPDGSGGVWVAGGTGSDDFPVTDDAYQGSRPGGRAAFVSRFSMPPAPTAAFTAAPTTGTAPLMVQFTDESTGYPTAWSWEYSTGNPGWTEFSTEQHPEYEFSEAGTHSIRLTVMNAGGEDTRTKDGYITVTDAIPPLPPSDDYEFILKWGSYGIGDGQFWMPRGVTVDSAGNVYVADRNNHRIQKFDGDGTFITKWGKEGYVDNGEFILPGGIAVDAAGNVYVADTWNHRIQKFDGDGTFITKWGRYGWFDGQFGWPYGVAVDADGNVYVADSGNHRIQKFDGDGTYITTWGTEGTGDGQFRWPWGIAVDSASNVYVVDRDNNRIQKFASDGTFITKWGAEGSGDGEFIEPPRGIAVDADGNVYVADSGNHRIQKFDSDGTYITKWGSSGTGDGQFRWPWGIAVDSAGKVYVADTENHRIQKFGPTDVPRPPSDGPGGIVMTLPSAFEPGIGGTYTFQGLSISSLEIETEVNLQNVVVTVERIHTLPEPINEPGWHVYQYVSVRTSHLTDEDIKTATIHFHIPVGYILGEGMKHADAALLRNVDEKWEVVKTTLLSFDERTMAYYKAEASGLSIFAIVLKKDGAATSPPVVEQSEITVEDVIIVEKDPADAPEPETTPDPAVAQDPIPPVASPTPEPASILYAPVAAFIIGLVYCACRRYT